MHFARRRRAKKSELDAGQSEFTEAQRKATTASIRTISIEDLKALAERLFPFIDHPWLEEFFTFLTENTGVTFYHAMAHDGVQIVLLPLEG